MEVSYPIINAGAWLLTRKVVAVASIDVDDIVLAKRITTGMSLTARSEAVKAKILSYREDFIA
jgi:hypothetical protein